ncbi:5075_t:CDS:2 [Gigaspora rosea]|nr:5075_t:CDS:2 [Gigaspora rosea]
MNKWYYKLVSEEYRTYIQQTIIQRDNKINNDNPNANELAGYYAYQPSKKDEIIWVPLLPGYTVYTKINDTFFKLSIMKDTNCQLIYQWYFYAKDETFKLLKDSGQDNICFKTCFSKYNWSENRSPLWYLGLSDKDNIYYGNGRDPYKKRYIDSSQDEILHTTINDLIEKWKLGSTLLVDTKIYLTLAFKRPCNNCGNYLISKRDCQLMVIGFKIKCQIRCKECETIIEISNKKKDICFSKAVAAGGLGAGVSRHAAQSFLAAIGITSQCSKTIYHNHQHNLFLKIIELAKSLTNNAIIKCIKHVEQSLTEQVNPTKLELCDSFKNITNKGQTKRDLWSKLSVLKEQYPLAPILILTTTCSYDDMQAIKKSINLLDTNLAIIRSNNQERKEIQYEVRQRHDMNGTVFDDMTNLIGEVTKDLTQSETADQCRMNMLIKHLAWSEDEEPSECAKCDNCHRHIKDNPTIKDVTPDIEELLHVIEILTTTYDHQIIPADLGEFYNQQDIKKSRKPKLLSTTELVEFALQDLVRRGLVLQDIILSRPHKTGYISCTLVIEGLSDGTKEIVKEQEWKYWIKN